MMNTPDVESDAPDEILAEVRRIKEKLAAEHGYDIHKMLEQARRDQAKSGRRILPPPSKKVEPSRS